MARLRKGVSADENESQCRELFRLCMLEEIESVHIVKPGKLKGVRLINKKSLDDYIRSFLPGGTRFQKSHPVQVRKTNSPEPVAAQ